MIIFLLTLLAVALVVIFVGYRLSPRTSHAPNRSRISYAGHVERTGRYVRASRGYSDYGYGYGYRAKQSRSLRASRGLERRSEGHTAALSVGSLFSSHVQQTPWLGLALILVICCLTGVLVFKTLLPGTPVLINSWPDVAASTPPPTTSSTTTTKPAFVGVIGASNSLARINQLDPAQYSSQQEFDTWAYSTCSAASMTEIIDAYNKYYNTGHQYRIADILKVESGLNEITPDQGLLRSTGIDHTVAQFNFQAQWLGKSSVDDLVRVASSGRPIIVDFPPDRWDGGHILVVRGGNKNSVYLADSSRLNMQVMARQTFLKYWAGWAVVVTPKGH